jgi:hypothetical protein
MAIIYETQTDFEREKLKDQSKDVYMQSASQGGTGLAALVVSSVIDRFNSNDSKALHLAGWAAAIFGGVKIIQSFFTAGKAHNLELQKERLGPQTVVFPPDVQSGVENGGKECCGKRKYADIKPTSFREQAEKHLSTLGRE